MADTTTQTRRYRSLIVFLVLVAVGLWVFYMLRSALFPFLVGIVLAYLLLPLVMWTERLLPAWEGRHKVTRVLSILLVFVVTFGVLGFLAYFVVTDVIDILAYILEHAPQFISRALLTIREWTAVFGEQFPPGMQQEVQGLILAAGTEVAEAAEAIVISGISFIPATVGLVFGFLLSPIFLFYVLRDYEGLSRHFHSAAFPWVAQHSHHIVRIVDGVLARYVRTQLMLGWVVAYFCFVGLLVLEVPAAAALAVLAGLMELIPIIGPWIALVVAAVFALATVPTKAIWVALLFLVVQQTENLVLAPRVHGSQFRIHPAIVLVLLVLGARFAGFWGLLLAVPIAATIVELYRYARGDILATRTGRHQTG